MYTIFFEVLKKCLILKQPNTISLLKPNHFIKRHAAENMVGKLIAVILSPGISFAKLRMSRACSCCMQMFDIDDMTVQKNSAYASSMLFKINQAAQVRSRNLTSGIHNYRLTQQHDSKLTYF